MEIWNLTDLLPDIVLRLKTYLRSDNFLTSLVWLTFFLIKFDLLSLFTKSWRPLCVVHLVFFLCPLNNCGLFPQTLHPSWLCCSRWKDPSSSASTSYSRPWSRLPGKHPPGSSLSGMHLQKSWWNIKPQGRVQADAVPTSVRHGTRRPCWPQEPRRQTFWHTPQNKHSFSAYF